VVDTSNSSDTIAVGPATTLTTAAEQLADKEADAYGMISDAQGHIGSELALSNSQRTLRVQFEHWASSYDFGDHKTRMVREEFALRSPTMIESDQRNNENKSSGDAMSFTIGTAVSTAIGTGAILWVVQATQLAATFISAAAPTWMQVDIATALNSLAREKSATDEASARIFE
jgi:hypothetical protein